MAVYNVRDSGASGDGVNPDTLFIRTAMDACRDAGGGEVYLPSGEYLVNGPIFESIDAGNFINSRLRIRGDGRAKHIRGKKTDSSRPFAMSVNRPAPNSCSKVESL